MGVAWSETNAHRTHIKIQYSKGQRMLTSANEQEGSREV